MKEELKEIALKMQKMSCGHDAAYISLYLLNLNRSNFQYMRIIADDMDDKFSLASDAKNAKSVDLAILASELYDKTMKFIELNED